LHGAKSSNEQFLVRQQNKWFIGIGPSAEGLKGFGKKKDSLAGRLLFPCLLARHENHFDKLCVRFVGVTTCVYVSAVTL
jgi:hypothetical protein